MDYSSGNAMIHKLMLTDKVFPKGSSRGMKNSISELAQSRRCIFFTKFLAELCHCTYYERQAK